MTDTRKPGKPEPGEPGRREAARHLLHRDQFRDSLALASQPSLRNSALAGVQAGLTAAIALPLFLLSPWAHLVGFASPGALVALFGRFAPAESRKRIVFLRGVPLVMAVLAMAGAAWIGTPSASSLWFWPCPAGSSCSRA